MLNFSGCPIGTFPCTCITKLTKEDINLIEKHSVYLKFRRGDMIFKQGSLSSHIMMVEDGLIKVFMENLGKTFILKLATKGHILDFSGLRPGSNVFPFSAVSYVDTIIRQIDIEAFNKILMRNHEFAKEIINTCTASSEQIYRRFFCLLYKQSYGRIADILLCLADRIFKSKEFNLPLKRNDLAELTGMNAETSIRILRKFHNDGLIRISGKTIEVLDYDRLIAISETG